jgi:endonuclease YncB( thermonuclease family)
VDADTFVVMVDCGLKTGTRQRLRLRGIDCPERTTKRGRYVRDYVKKLLDRQDFVIVKTYKDEKYGRVLADVFYLKDEKDPAAVVQKGIFLNQALLDKGLAEPWKG